MTLLHLLRGAHAMQYALGGPQCIRAPVQLRRVRRMALRGDGRRLCPTSVLDRIANRWACTHARSRVGKNQKSDAKL
jgi:hypothetical protein